MRNIFDFCAALIALASLGATVFMSYIAFAGYPPAMLMALIAQCLMLVGPYPFVWIYFRKRVYAHG